LDSVGVRFAVQPSDGVEPPIGSLPPRELVAASALAKGSPVAADHPGSAVMSADTIVALGDDAASVLGKPRDAVDALRMLSLISGRSHRVLTGVCLFRDGKKASGISETTVQVRKLDAGFCERYVASGEPLDKAGSYGAQGLMGTRIERIEGSWTNVVGLPLESLAALFEELGLQLSDFQVW
jgi:septum formation protein